MNFSETLLFFGKVFLIDILVELLRQALYALWFNTWAKKLLHASQKNKFFNWFLQIFETLCIIALLYSGYGMAATVLIVCGLTVLVKEAGNKIIPMIV